MPILMHSYTCVSTNCADTGDSSMKNRNNDDGARANFNARHNCDEKTDKSKVRTLKLLYLHICLFLLDDCRRATGHARVRCFGHSALQGGPCSACTRVCAQSGAKATVDQTRRRRTAEAAVVATQTTSQPAM